MGNGIATGSTDIAALGARAMAMLDTLGAISDAPDNLTRLYLSPAHRRAAHQVRDWMEAAGCEAHIDAAGNVVGRYGPAEGPVLYCGSHIDTVIDAGRFDGSLGVVAAILAVEALAGEGRVLPFAIEILAFGDEENVRFPTSLSSTQAIAGGYDPRWLDVVDGDGVSLAQALREFGGDPDAVTGLARDPAQALGYLELHIEQGPVLERADLPVGVVTAIAAAWRADCVLRGQAGHAGTVPMGLRRDALSGAAEMIAAIEGIGAQHEGGVATVGRIAAVPGAVNVIPGEVRFSIDARAPGDAMLATMLAEIDAACKSIAERRGLAFTQAPFMRAPATPMAEPLQQAFAAAAHAIAGDAPLIPSGAGHDAVAMARLCPVGMLFVRCAGGISHNPAESITQADAGCAVAVLIEAIRRIAADQAAARG
ncbi:MAG: allantoate amidohydrolase [Salinarimonas sp.]|nr:allantoate amidohydrolase [Salinarimonas sp.]